MTKPTFGTHPFLLGFDELERLVERTARTGNEGYPPYNFDQIADMMDRVLTADTPQPTYPPYNIEKTGEDAWRISVAVAGFAEDDLSITLEDRQLVVRGRSAPENEDRVFLHRGIAARQFQRAFVLADGMEVSGAILANGLLHIDLKRSAPENVIKTIRIQSGTRTRAPQETE